MSVLKPEFQNLLRDPSFCAQPQPGGLVFAFQDNLAAISQWQTKFQSFREAQTQRINQLERSLTEVDLPPLTTERLQNSLAAEKEYLQELESFAQAQLPNSAATQSAVLNQRIPSQQHFESYHKNIFRDWVWGEAETNIYKNFLGRLKQPQGASIIVGGGAGRLLHDYCELRPDCKVTQIDINPFLCWVSQKLCSGESLALTEWGLQSSSLKQTLKPVKPVSQQQYQILVGDILQHPFRDQVFKTIICPFVIDILPENFFDFSKRLNTLLENEGELLIFGPLSFEKQSVRHRFSHPEILETLSQNGFELISSEQVEIPYLQSPLDAQKRFEKISLFHARKIKAAKKPKNFQHFPDWLIDTSLKLNHDEKQKLLPIQAQKNVEAQFLAALINGQSIHDMALAIAQSGSGLNPTQAEEFVRSQFARLIELSELK